MTRTEMEGAFRAMQQEKFSQEMDIAYTDFLVARAAKFGTSIASQVMFDIDMEIRSDEKVLPDIDG